MVAKVSVKPALLRWARERASLAPPELARRVGLNESRVIEWEATGELPLAHLERLASKTYTPIGFLFLPEPPEEELPIPDFRTVESSGVRRPSPNLLDTIYQCQQRQGWYRDFLAAEGEDPLPFVGSATTSEPPAAVAQRLRARIGIETDQRAAASTWEKALTLLVEKVEAARILVMRNGVVGNNTHRKLDVSEFRGFALSDAYAPLVFINAADAKTAQMFTLAHEVTHLWLGQSGVSDPDPRSGQATERFCNAVAAEVLVPLKEFLSVWHRTADPLNEARRLAREFKVSTLVMLIRAAEAEMLAQTEFEQLYAGELAHGRGGSGDSGGDFYRTQLSRLGKEFPRAVIATALEGRTTYTEAFQLLGLKSATSFDGLARNLGLLP